MLSTVGWRSLPGFVVQGSDPWRLKNILYSLFYHTIFTFLCSKFLLHISIHDDLFSSVKFSCFLLYYHESKFQSFFEDKVSPFLGLRIFFSWLTIKRLAIRTMYVILSYILLCISIKLFFEMKINYFLLSFIYSVGFVQHLTCPFCGNKI